jgi:biopolymer transport protein ExbB
MHTWFFLWQATDSLRVTSDGAKETMSVFSLIMKGGPILIPIVLLSFIAVYIIVERFLYINRASRIPAGQMAIVKDQLRQGKVDMALTTLKQRDNSFSRILRIMIKKVGSPIDEIEHFVETASSIEISAMSRNLNYLGIIAGIAPMLGFIGTISGIIRIFYNISVTDNISIGVIAGGLYEKMITSGAGLVVGLIAYTGYHLLHGKVDRFATTIEEELFEFLNFITDPTYEN